MSKGGRYERTDEELEAKLREQIGFLQRAVRRFDEGYTLEAIHIATILRVLLHSGRSPSLLQIVGRDSLRFVDTAKPPHPGNLVPSHNLVQSSFSDEGLYFFAPLDDLPVRGHVPFESWWNGPVFAHPDGVALSRRDVVLHMANKDGGAHVDPVLPDDFYKLLIGDFALWRHVAFNGEQLAVKHVERHAIRQIAHEVLRTLVQGYRRSAEEAHAHLLRPGFANGGFRFAPGRENTIQYEQAVSAGTDYRWRLTIKDITCGNIRVSAGSVVSEPLCEAGQHAGLISARSSEAPAISGEFTDATITFFNFDLA